MRLLNFTLGYLSIGVLVIIGVWGALFYFSMMEEFGDSLDDGLEDQKERVLSNIHHLDFTNASRSSFLNNFRITEISELKARYIKEQFSDTLIMIPEDDEPIPYRMLTTVFKDDGKYYKLQLVASTLEQDDLLERLFQGLLWLYGLVLLSIVVVNKWMLRKIWRPFYATLEKMLKFRIDEHEVIHTGHSRVREFSELNDAFEKLALHAVTAFADQRKFIENAAHELQTPLAISLNRLELFLESYDLNADQMAEIQRVIENLERSSRLNRTLLMLARIENRQYGADELVSVNEICINLLEDLDDFIREKDLTVRVYETGTLQISMNRDLAHILILNLFKNAIKYNSFSGELIVRIKSDGFQIENTGVDYPLEGEKIFQRFYKGSSDSTNVGLGLAIVKGIVDYYGMYIRYSFVNNRHRMFVKVT